MPVWLAFSGSGAAVLSGLAALLLAVRLGARRRQLVDQRIKEPIRLLSALTEGKRPPSHASILLAALLGISALIAGVIGLTLVR